MDNLIDFAALKQPVEFADLFNSIVSSKAAQRLEDIKMELAQNLYSDDDGEDYGDVDDGEEIYDELADLDDLLGDEDEDS